MSDVMIYLTIASSLIVLLFLLSLFVRKSSSGDEEEGNAEPKVRPVPRARDQDGPPRRIAGTRQVRSRLNRQRQHREEEPETIDDDENADEDAMPQFALPEEKIGAKKKRKLEMKAEKKAMREAELEEREERKQRQAALDEQRQAESERQKQEELKRAEEERKLEEEKEKQEREEYLKLKATFTIDSEGFEETVDENQAKNLLNEFVNYVKNEKVVNLEDLASHFKLKTQEVIDRIQNLLESEILTGVVDDRGKFIYIPREELEAVAKFIKRRGRISIAELSECSNSLITINRKTNSETDR